jgi:hypothetical protein
VSELVGSVFIGLADIVTDGIACALLMHGRIPGVPSEGYKTAYIAVLSFGVVTTVFSLAYRFHNARLMRENVLELSDQGRTASSSAVRRQAQQNEWELAQTRRTKVSLSLGLLSVAAQGPLPLRRSCMYRPSSPSATGRNLIQQRLQVCRCQSSTSISSSSAASKTRWSVDPAQLAISNV